MKARRGWEAGPPGMEGKMAPSRTIQNTVLKVLALALGVTMVATPAQAFILMTTDYPCADITINPPGAGFGSCNWGGAEANGVFTGSSTAQTMQVDATFVNNDTHVEWSLNETLDRPETFTIYRGVHPSEMEAVAEISGEARSFVDEGALTSGSAVWYQVQAHWENGTVVESEPVPVHGAYVAAP